MSQRKTRHSQRRLRFCKSFLYGVGHAIALDSLGLRRRRVPWLATLQPSPGGRARPRRGAQQLDGRIFRVHLQLPETNDLTRVRFRKAADALAAPISASASIIASSYHAICGKPKDSTGRQRNVCSLSHPRYDFQVVRRNSLQHPANQFFTSANPDLQACKVSNTRQQITSRYMQGSSRVVSMALVDVAMSSLQTCQPVDAAPMRGF